MKIAYIGGNCGDGSPPFSTENAYIDAFRGLGHEVTPVRQGEARAAVGGPILDADLVVYTRTHRPDALPAQFTDIWRLLEGEGVKTCSIHLDVFRGLPEREAWVEGGDPLFTTGTVFTADGSAPEWWEARGVNHVWLPPAADLRHARGDGDLGPGAEPFPDLADKVIFVGSEQYHSAYPFRPKLIAHLRATYRDRFLIYGPGAGITMRMHDLARLYASDAIFVGDHCFATEGRPNYWSDRLPETLGRGGLLIYPRTDGMEEQGFDEDDCLFCYEPGDLADLDRVIYAATEEESLRKRRGWMRDWGRGTVLARHTYPLRARQVLDHLGLA